MAKALKAGDAVTVAKNYRFKKNSDEFKRLLQSGSGSSIEPNTVVEIQMDDLPGELQAQIQKLVQAKLALGPQTTARKPGRPPKQVENIATESTQPDGEAPRRPGRPKGSGK